MLDPAGLRPGRFDKLLYTPSPDEESRLQTFKIYTKNMPLTKDVSLNGLAAETKGYSGADIQAACNEAGMNALRRNINAKEVTREDFRNALARIGPSLTADMEKFYENFSQGPKRLERTVIPSAIA